MRLRIASRQSDLARIQAHAVAKALRASDPSLEIEFHFSESLGDKNLRDPLWKMPEKGVFTADLTQDLIAGRADMVVHSWKDLPVEENDQTVIVASLPRADVRDLLLFKKSSRARLAKGEALRIFSSSPRREYNLKPFLRKALPGSPGTLEFTSVRGNIPTRCRKLLQAENTDGLVVAKAAVDRLLSATAEEFQEGRSKVQETLDQCDWMILPLSQNPAAPAQGALAIEIRRDREDLRKVLAKIHDEKTFREANLERGILKSHGGGCHQKIGATVLDRPGGRLRFLRGLTEAGQVLREVSLEGSASSGETHVLRSDWLFERSSLSSPPPADLKDAALFVAHSSAWIPRLEASRVVWTAGLRTWEKLARRGVWVNGSTEGLGEVEDPRLGGLAPDPRWVSLSHEASESRHPVWATYRLVPKDEVEPPPREGVLHWTSAFLFKEALRRWPELRGRQHSCGPGKTYEALKNLVPNLKVRWLVEDAAP